MLAEWLTLTRLPDGNFAAWKWRRDSRSGTYARGPVRAGRFGSEEEACLRLAAAGWNLVARTPPADPFEAEFSKDGAMWRRPLAAT